MTASIPGIHHITAIGGAAQENLDFYTGVLGLRLVKTTVNFDDPTTYHLYYGDRMGRPGTVLTFFPWPRAVQGRVGAGAASAVSFAVPSGTRDAWRNRLADAGVSVETTERFGTDILQFQAPDGLPLEIVPDPALTASIEESSAEASVWTESPVPVAQAIRGFFGTTLPALNLPRTAELFTEVFGWTVETETSDRVRLRAPSSGEGEAPENAVGQTVDLQKQPSQAAGRMGRGTVHHVAMRARDAEEQAAWQSALRDRGLQVTDVKDRQYFQSIYFRDADWTSGVLFEIATDGPGFLIDEDEDALGTTLRLPSWLEERRSELEERLPPLDRPTTATA